VLGAGLRRHVPEARREEIGNVRRCGDGVKAVPARSDPAVDEGRGRPFVLGVDDRELAFVAAVGERGLKVGRIRGDRERKVEDALGPAGGDQADNRRRGIRVALGPDVRLFVDVNGMWVAE
jgi:L-alanine-DL-glutamate epimerase-like enolase superfamily enzyme